MLKLCYLKTELRFQCWSSLLFGSSARVSTSLFEALGLFITWRKVCRRLTFLVNSWYCRGISKLVQKTWKTKSTLAKLTQNPICVNNFMDSKFKFLRFKRLHNEELNDLYSSPNIVRVIKSRRMMWAGHMAYMGEERGVYRVLVGKPEGKRPLGRPRRRWVDNIRTDLQEVGCGYMDWIGLAQNRDRWRTLVSAVMNLRVPWNAGNFLTNCKPVSCSRRTLHHGVNK